MTKLRLIRSIWASSLLALALGGGLAYADADTTSPTVSSSSTTTTIITSDSKTTTTTSDNTQATASSGVSVTGDQPGSDSNNSSPQPIDNQTALPSSNNQVPGSETPGPVNYTQTIPGTSGGQGDAGVSNATNLNQWVKDFDYQNAYPVSPSDSSPHNALPVLSQPQSPVAPATPQLPALPQSNPAAILQQLSMILAGSVKTALLGFGGLPPVPGLVPALVVVVGIVLIASRLIFRSLYLKFSWAEGFARAPRGSTLSRAYNPFATPLKMSLIALGVP